VRFPQATRNEKRRLLDEVPAFIAKRLPGLRRTPAQAEVWRWRPQQRGILPLHLYAVDIATAWIELEAIWVSTRTALVAPKTVSGNVCRCHCWASTAMLNHRTLQRTQRYIQGAEGRRRAEQDLREALVEVARVRPSTDERPGRQTSAGRFIF